MIKKMLEVKNSERSYEFHCDETSPLGETYDALARMLNFVISKIKETEAQTLNEEPKKE